MVQKESEVSDTQVTGFCAKSKCKEHILCLQIGSCNSHIHIHSITLNYGQQVGV